MWKLLILPALAACAAGEICPLGGPVFPAPRRALDTVALNQTTRNLISSLETILRPTNDTEATAIDATATSFTVQVYSARDSRPLFEYYHTATSARNNTIGVNHVDENTVFRIGSCSKLWTVLLLLLETGDATFNEPVFKYIPELQAAIEKLKGNDTLVSAIEHVDWEELTVGELASQMAGLERSYGLADRSTTPDMMEQLGFPRLPSSAVPECGIRPTCNREQFFAGPMKRHPVVPTSSTPIYSNDAYQLLGYVIEAQANQTFKKLVEERLIKRLNLTHSSYNKPADHLGIIPAPGNATDWDLDMQDFTPTGGLYSSTKDLNTLGRAILNHDLLSPALTRRWLKPAARSADNTFSVGHPWEIFTVDDPRTITLYTKSGDLGGYSTMVGLSPDHDAGFTILAAGEGTTQAIWAIGDIIATIGIRGLEAAAKEEAKQRFGGTYMSANSSLELTTDDGPGLRIAKWHKEEIDMLKSVATLFGADPEGDIDIRLYPTGLESPGRISFRSILSGPSPTGPANGPLTRVCKAWMLVDGQAYGTVALDAFVFDVGEDGDAVRVSPRALRMSLDRDIS
ncbi:beta-lactamase/transpeptidase-like protein [Aspergillus varians]